MTTLNAGIEWLNLIKKANQMTPQEAVLIMIDKGMTQAEIANKAETSEAAISFLATGKRQTTYYELGVRLVRLGKLAQRRKGKQNEKK